MDSQITKNNIASLNVHKAGTQMTSWPHSEYTNFHQWLQLKVDLLSIKVPRHIPKIPRTPLSVTKLTLNEPAKTFIDVLFCSYLLNCSTNFNVLWQTCSTFQRAYIIKGRFYFSQFWRYKQSTAQKGAKICKSGPNLWKLVQFFEDMKSMYEITYVAILWFLVMDAIQDGQQHIQLGRFTQT